MFVEHPLHLGAVGDVEPGGAGLATRLAQAFGFALGRLAVDVAEGDLGARFRERLGIGEADARGRARHQARTPLDVELIEDRHQLR